MRSPSGYKISPPGGSLAARASSKVAAASPPPAANDNSTLIKATENIVKALELVRSIKATPTVRHDRGFNSLGEFAAAVVRAERDIATDSRLVRAPAGANVNDPSAGGFLVQHDLVDGIIRSVYERATIAPYCDLRITANPIRETRIPSIDEASRADGQRNGGATAYFLPEGTTAPKSILRYKSVTFQPKKLIGLAKVTNELLNDVPMLSAHLEDVLGDEIGFQLDRAVLLGTGAGVPTGILNLPALITVAKETGQAPSTFVKENLDKMWARFPAASRKRGVWLISEDLAPQLMALNSQVGGGGFSYQPPGAIPGSPYASLYGRPIIETEQSPTLGTLGDIVLADLSRYTVVSAPAQFTMSLHSGFDTDEATLRLTYYVDARAVQSSPLLPYQGSVTKSPFVTLAARP